MKSRLLPLACALPFAAPALAQTLDTAVTAEPVVVTATRLERPAARVPASIDVIDGERLREGQAQVNLSETLPTIPGVVANHRQNYAQDLQISIRGSGARSTFGVRGLRVIVDGIPATLPDGQGQVSHIDLVSAGRVEVLRGPFSVLHGNAAGGVINVISAVPAEPFVARITAMGGSDGTRRFSALAGGGLGAISGLVSAGHFETRGFREHSAAKRTNANALLRFEGGPATRLTLVANAMDMPDTQDPLGLTRAQLERDPRSVDPAALQFDTRKSVDQRQAGVVLDQVLGASLEARVALYAGSRGTQQFQAIPTGPQASPLHPGGVIDLARDYGGADLRLAWHGRLGTMPLALVGGANLDRLDEERRGYQNFVGTQLGVQGALRRDESNRVTEAGQYAQAELDLTADLRLLAGVRASRVTFRSDDHFVTGANPDDSGRLRFRATTPVAGASWRVAPALHLHAAAGRGFETPTANELAYRPAGGSGLNLDLRPARSDHFELGAKWLDPEGWRAAAALFRVDTEDEIVVASNVGGRSTFRNAGATRREGIELQAERDWGAFGASMAFTRLKAVYRDGFLICTGAPCATPNVAVPAGNRIPGVPLRTAYAELRWRPVAGLQAALEARHSDRLPVNDLNTDAAGRYTVAAVRVGYTWRRGGLVVKPFVRVDNVFDRRYVGSVIVNEGNGRFFEPAPGRSFLAGVTLQPVF